MRRLGRVLVGLLCAGLLVAGCVPEGSYRPDVGMVQPPGGSKMDRDQNKIFDSLDQLLANVGEKDPVDVVIMANPSADPLEVAQSAGLKVKFRYSVIPAIAASATKGQVQVLARHPGVRQIEYDDEVRLFLDGASQSFGVTQARANFGVTGDRDGAGTYTKNDVVVAVIDTGIDAGHVDLAGKVIAWQDFVNNKTDPYDDHGHGTHVAGTVAGKGAGNAAYTGVAPGAALVGLKVLNQYGSGNLSNLLAAMDWVAAHKEEFNIRVMSMSLGTGRTSDGTDSISQAANRLAESGVVAVIAAGNAGPSRYTVGSPGAAEKAITIGAIADPTELGFGMASFSSRGPTEDGRTKPDIVAPGVEIMAPRAGSTNGYVSYSGTSMATPFVAGVVALMLDANPNLTPEQVKQILHATAIDWGPPGPDVDYGWGRLDGHAAVRAAGNFQGGTPPALPAHRYITGEIATSGGKSEHSIVLTNIDYPLDVTLIMPEWESRSNPDFDLTVYGPDGSEFAKASGTVRQEQVAKKPTQTGTYRLEVKSYTGTGPYFIDVSAGMAAFDRPPVVAIVAPEEDAILSGTAEVKVRASDDVGVEKVEVRVDSDAWVDITPGYDGSDYRYNWDTATVADGLHTIQARATDRGERQAFDDRHVQVVNQSSRSYEVVRSGEVTADTRVADVTVSVHEEGYLELELDWPTTADLDFEVYAPDGRYVGRAYSLNNPEKMRVDTVTYGTGTYRIRALLYGGVDTAFTLTAGGFRRTAYTGSVSPEQRESTHTFPVLYSGRGLAQLGWSGTSDLDFYVLGPEGRERARAYTVNNPEVADILFDASGTWTVRVNLYDGAGAGYTLHLFVPAAILT